MRNSLTYPTCTYLIFVMEWEFEMNALIEQNDNYFE